MQMIYGCKNKSAVRTVGVTATVEMQLTVHNKVYACMKYFIR